MTISMVSALEPLLRKRPFLRERELLEVLPFSRSTFVRMVTDEGFPRPRRFTRGIKYWLADEVRAWAEAWDRE